MVKWCRFVAGDFDLEGEQGGGANWLRPGPLRKEALLLFRRVGVRTPWVRLELACFFLKFRLRFAECFDGVCKIMRSQYSKNIDDD